MRVALRIGISSAALAALAVLWVLIAPYYSTIVWWELRRSLFWLLPLLLLVLLGIAAAALVDEYVLPAWPFVLLGIAGAVGFLFWIGWGHSYAQARVYAGSVQVTDDAVPELGQRAPYVVAVAQARPNLGDSPGDIAGTKFLPDTQTYTTLVEARGWLAGYQTALEQSIPLTGRGTGHRCEFGPEADARVSGWFGHNLGRLVASQVRWARFDGEDVYAYCDGDTPKVVLPLKEQDGWLLVTERPAGVAVYDGATGEVTVQPDGDGAAGPTYPISLAATQRESTHALSDLWDYVFGRAGWDDTDEEQDVNSENNSEFTLPHDGAGQYVTPLTGRGSATSISAISTVDVRAAGDALAPLVVHRLDPPWVSTSAIAQRIQADYQDIPNWQNLRILEVAPTGSTRWVATIGNDQNVLYRVEGDGALEGDEATCLHRGDGTRIRCGTVADQGGSGVGTQYGPGGGPAVPVAPDADLSTLTDQQLLDLAGRAQQEIARRLTTPG